MPKSRRKKKMEKMDTGDQVEATHHSQKFAKYYSEVKHDYTSAKALYDSWTNENRKRIRRRPKDTSKDCYFEVVAYKPVKKSENVDTDEW